MNLHLSIDEICECLESKTISISNSKLLNILDNTWDRTIEMLKPIIMNKQTGLECGKGLTNPLLWEFGHVLSFYQHMTLKNLKIQHQNTCDEQTYDSFIVKRDDREKVNLLNIHELLSIHTNVINDIKKYILSKNDDMSPKEFYLIFLSILHNEMHIESFIFTQQSLGYPLFNYVPEKASTNNKDIEFIDIQEGDFVQGSNKDDFFVFDNEMPSFKKHVNSFSVSKYCITNYQYMQFVEDKGYEKSELWSKQGIIWLKESELEMPLYWKFTDTWKEIIFNKEINLRLDHPVCHITWFEANAYCKWKNVSLLTETEWEYLAKNKDKAHLDYNGKGTISVYNDRNINMDVVGLFGNVWEWCQEPIYPYDGFIIDPVYREMSYPYFGFKRICRGGSWCVPNYLVHKSYRNAQLPDCNWQYIGFRVKK